MAEGWSSSVLCRYFMNGCCRDGSTCRFSHDRQASQPSMACRYYLKGSCAYGDRCRYDHVRVPTPSGSTSLSSPSSSTSSCLPSSSAATSSQNKAANLLSKSTELNKSTRSATNNTNRQDSGNMTVLHKRIDKKNDDGDESKTSSSDLGLCADAPEFVPGSVKAKSYAEVIEDPSETKPKEVLNPEDILCPYAMMGECRYGNQCAYIHGDVCEQCSQACLHPNDAEQRKQHQLECLKEHERDMELSFAVARSKDKICTICMDVIMEKWPHSERRFGILPNCNHIFCLACIRTWRSTKQLENKTVRSCPQCRTPSDFVTPSKWWIESKDEKDKLIESYKKALSLKACKYFNQGIGECPFAGNCFYLHAYPDGQKATALPPRPRRRRNAENELEMQERILLWEYLEERESRWFLHLDWEDMLDFVTDSDDITSDDNYSDFDIDINDILDT